MINKSDVPNLKNVLNLLGKKAIYKDFTGEECLLVSDAVRFIFSLIRKIEDAPDFSPPAPPAKVDVPKLLAEKNKKNVSTSK